MLSIAICAHPDRHHTATKLAQTLRATTVFDTDGVGSTANHARAWQAALEGGGDWVGVVEDDAAPVNGVLDQLEEILTYAPTDLVSGYLGTGRPITAQPLVRDALTRDPQWILSTHLYHHVAVFARAHLVPAMIDYLGSTVLDCDSGLGVWARSRRIPVTYPVPSPFDHLDPVPLVPDSCRREDRGPRRAWVHGRRDVWDASGVVLLDGATRNKYGGRYGQTQGA